MHLVVGCALHDVSACRAGPNYPYDYPGTWEGSNQQINASNYYDAQKHAFLQSGTQGWFQWNYRLSLDYGARESYAATCS